MSTRRLLAFGTIGFLLTLLVAAAALAFAVARILFAILLGVLINAPIATNAGNQFVPVTLQASSVLPMAYGVATVFAVLSVSCFLEAARRRVWRS
jgi:hypothetical protein